MTGSANNLTELQRLILAILEEAGEEEFPTLMNTLLKRPGSAEQVAPVVTALTGLIQSDLIRIACSRGSSLKALGGPIQGRIPCPHPRIKISPSVVSRQ